MNLQDFNFNLPEELIAQQPVEKRSASRLMVLNSERGTIEHKHFSDIVDYFKTGDIIVLNDTKVIKARLKGRKKTGGKVELIVFRDLPENKILALVKGYLKKTDTINIDDCELALVNIREGLYSVEISGCSFDELLEKAGVMPLPPYIKREPCSIDEERYQTIFGKCSGAVAAPTAALHFDQNILNKLALKGVEIVFITLHVGVGTFLPVKSENISAHNMLPEFFEITENTANIINRGIEDGRSIIFCGTTTVRAVEYSSKERKVIAGKGKADIFIYPGYKFKVVEKMLTNFHLPHSTPLFLVSALAGRERILNAYNEAIDKKYRFFSYGDAMLIL